MFNREIVIFAKFSPLAFQVMKFQSVRCVISRIETFHLVKKFDKSNFVVSHISQVNQLFVIFGVVWVAHQQNAT